MAKINRNEPCPCGSGKKYKKCCFPDTSKNNELIRAIQLSKSKDNVIKILSEKSKIFTFKVRLLSSPNEMTDKEVYRIIKIDGKHTLYDLHLIIQDAFNWDNDHMYSFYLGKSINDRKNEYSSNPLGEHITSTFGEQTKSAADTQIRDLKLKVNKKFMYLFDYGDQILHKITVLGIEDLPENTYENGKIIKKIGKAPKQYINKY